VGEVVRFVEGSQSKSRSGRGNAATPFTEMWKRVDEAVSDIIDHTTFAELVRLWADRQARYVPNWDI
jgi:DNA-binding IscR family transcriptional regulator